MAAICFGPPPLPPNKKSLLATVNGHRTRKTHLALSSTYHSFRDPCDELNLGGSSPPNYRDELKAIGYKLANASIHDHEDVESLKQTQTPPKTRMKVSHSNSLRREKKNVKLSLARSHSEGNLSRKSLSMAPTTINKCIKVLSGSWKNLLQRKSSSMTHKT